MLELFAEHPELWWAVAASSLAGATLGVGAVVFWRRRGRRVFHAWSAEHSSYLRGVNYMLQSDADAAIEELTKVVEVNPSTVETYFALGALFRTKGEVERAIRIHQNLAGRESLDARTRTQARFELGLDYRAAGLTSRATAAFERVIAEEPAFVDAHRELERLYEEAREWEKAFAMQREVASRSGQRADGVLAHLMVEVGRTHEEQGELEKARACYRRARSIDRTSMRAYVALGELALREGDAREAIAHYERARRQNPSLAGLVYPKLEECYARLGDFRRYEALLRQQVVQDEMDVFARLALGQLLERQGRTHEAIEELRRALEHKPDFVEARKALGAILQASGSAAELRREYEDLLAALVHPTKSFQCRQCGFEAPQMQWKCPQCQHWDTTGYKRFRRERKNRHVA
jgi:lipopolysaccharide biosynthesis regulator YciM